MICDSCQFLTIFLCSVILHVHLKFDLCMFILRTQFDILHDKNIKLVNPLSTNGELSHHEN